ncbi:hypothetical protein FI667_g14365, partial [Globisporangium splendens]
MGTTSEAGAEEDLELMELDDGPMDDVQHPGHRSPAKAPKSEFELLEETRLVENQKELVALQRLDDKCIRLQQEGKYTEALECMEKGLVLRQHFFGGESDEVRSSCKTVGEMCNLLAMTYLQQEEFPVVLELLKKAEILTEKHQAGRAVTLNNFACYYRRQGNLHKSLTYLTEAIKIETKLDSVANKADTHLNLSAVLSQLGKHQSALGHAQSALILLHEELQLSRNNNNQSPPKHNSSQSNNYHNFQSGGSRTEAGDLGPSKLDRIAVLGTAYHNVGVEHEFLKCYDQSLQSYKKGVEITSQFLGDGHGIVITLQNSLVKAKRNVAAKGRTDGKTGDGISGLVNSKKPNRFALLKSSLKSTLGKKKALVAGSKPSKSSLRSQNSRIATEG